MSNSYQKEITTGHANIPGFLSSSPTGHYHWILQKHAGTKHILGELHSLWWHPPNSLPWLHFLFMLALQAGTKSLLLFPYFLLIVSQYRPLAKKALSNKWIPLPALSSVKWMHLRLRYRISLVSPHSAALLISPHPLHY